MTPAALREAARAALSTFQGADPGGEVLRASVEVRVGGDSELVALRFGDSDVAWSCTCGQSACTHARAALATLAAAGGSAGKSSPPARSSFPPGSSDVRVREPTARAERVDTEGLAAALYDVVTAVARVGARAGEAASVRDALRPLLGVAPDPLPLGMLRWVGRLRLALADEAPGALAHVLHGAIRVATDLRNEAHDDDARVRIAAFLGVLARDAAQLDRISDRSLIEVAREWVDGLEMGNIERRYMIDPHSGQVFTEERAVGSPPLSLGPCPRTLQVGLAEIEAGPVPRRLNLLQYAASPDVDVAAWRLVCDWASRDWSALLDGFRAAVTQAPGLVEPFALTAPASVEVGEGEVVLYDAEGRGLPLDPGPVGALLDTVAAQVDAAAPHFICGRLVARDGFLCLRPLGICGGGEGVYRYTRL